MEIEKLAREANMAQGIDTIPRWLASTEGLARFSAAVRREALLAAAEICDEDSRNPDQFRDAATSCAAAIRALADKP